MNKGIYLVTDSTNIKEDVFLEIIETACKSGIKLLQLREKEKSSREYLDLAIKVKKISDTYTVPLIIDDRIDIALACDASGVHVGDSDMPVDVARKLMGKDKIIGATAKTLEASLEAQKLGADYLGVGAIYPTTTKVKTKLTSTETLNTICNAVDIPVYAIGGLNKDNIFVLKDIKISGVAVVSAIMKASDVKQAIDELQNTLNNL